MKAITFDQPGGPEVLRLSDVPDPTVPTGDADWVLVRNFATALNRADLLQCRGLYPPPPGASEILGLEFAGEILETAPGVTEFRVGDRVFGLLAGGGYAEKVLTHSRMLLRIPETFSYEAAAALPEAFFTAYENLFTHGLLRDGETVLVHAGASGVGTAAIQLARRVGATVLATAGSAAKTGRCGELGADEVIDYTATDFCQRVVEVTDGRGVDLILDMVGAAHWEKNLASLGTDGRIVVIGLVGGAEVELNLATLLTRRLRVIGTTMRGLPLEAKVAITDRFRQHVLPDLETGKLKAVIDTVFHLDEARAAHERMAANTNVGKIVLRL